MDGELTYLQKRAEEERRAAEQAANDTARAAHESLAAQYEARLKEAANALVSKR